MNKAFIPLLAQAIENYVVDEDLLELGQIFSTEIPYRELRPNYLQLARALVSTPECGSNREFLNALAPLVLWRNNERCAHTSFERREFHQSFGARIQVLTQLVGDQLVPASVTVQEDHPFSAKSEARDLLGKAGFPKGRR
jgi:hypothetical protein